jgi:hypothetical protein
VIVAVAVGVAVGVGVGVGVIVAVGVGEAVAVGVGGSCSDSTKIGLLVPVMEGLLVSVAVIVWYPSVLSVGINMPIPLGKGESGGRYGWWSVLVKCTVPGYPVTVVLN